MSDGEANGTHLLRTNCWAVCCPTTEAVSSLKQLEVHGVSATSLRVRECAARATFL